MFKLKAIPWAATSPLGLGLGFHRFVSQLDNRNHSKFASYSGTFLSPRVFCRVLFTSHSYYSVLFSSLQFSLSAVSDSLWPHESQHTKPPCASPTLRVYSNSCPSSRWCHPAISSSVIPFSSCPQSLPASGSFQMTQLFSSGDQSIGVSASASVLPMNTQDWSPLGWTGWISLQSKGLSKSLLQHCSSKASILLCSAFFRVQLSHPYMTTGKTIALTRRTFAGKVMSLLFNMLSRLVITFLPRSKHLLISWLQSPSVVILEPPKIKSDTVILDIKLSYYAWTLTATVCYRISARSCPKRQTCRNGDLGVCLVMSWHLSTVLSSLPVGWKWRSFSHVEFFVTPWTV